MVFVKLVLTGQEHHELTEAYWVRLCFHMCAVEKLVAKDIHKERISVTEIAFHLRKSACVNST